VGEWLDGVNLRGSRGCSWRRCGLGSCWLQLASHNNPLISESGIKTKEDAQFIYDNTGIKNFLIGESLLSSGKTNQLIKEIQSITL